MNKELTLEIAHDNGGEVWVILNGGHLNNETLYN